MKEQKLLLEVNNNKTVLVRVIDCIHKNKMAINLLNAEESPHGHGYIAISIEAEREEVDALIKRLESLDGVCRVTRVKTATPSSELQNSFEE